jgi:uncharacterized membrane protein (TIGR02234 family)
MTAGETDRVPFAARRGRSLAVVTALVGAGATVVGSTQTWLTVGLPTGEAVVSGAEAVPVLQPLGLAALALALVLAIVGVVLRHVLAVLAVIVGATVSVLSFTAASSPGVGHVAGVVSEHTGIAGESGVAELMGGITATVWPSATTAAGALIAAAGLWALFTGARWRRAGRRYETDGARSSATHDGPLDAIDSWDDLSRGDDPTR